MELSAAILGQICLSDLIGHIEELLTAYGDASLSVCSLDIEDNTTNDVNLGVAGCVNFGADSEQVRLIISQAVNSCWTCYVELCTCIKHSWCVHSS